MRSTTERLAIDPRFRPLVLVGNDAELRPWAAEWAPHASIVAIDAPRYSWRTEWEWRRIAPELPRGAVTWFPHWDAPRAGQRGANVVTVHDIIPLLVPSAGWLRRAGMRWWLTGALRRATKVATPSDTTAKLLAERSATPPITVVYNGCDFVPSDGTSAAHPPITHDPFVLIVANRKPHKGFDIALDAFARLRAQWPALQLVVCGEHFDTWDNIRARAEALGVHEAVIDIGTVSDDHLMARYQRAHCLLAPARMEGFGLPLIEAMRMGCPVVASDIGAHREVAGDAATLVPVGDAKAMADAVLALRDHPTRRTQLVAAGHARSQTFTWERSADQLGTLLLDARDTHHRGAV